MNGNQTVTNSTTVRTGLPRSYQPSILTEARQKEFNTFIQDDVVPPQCKGFEPGFGIWGAVTLALLFAATVGINWKKNDPAKERRMG